MNKECITQRQAACMVALFTVGSSIVLGIGRKSMQDSWIAFLIAIAAIMPVGFMYARLMKLYPGKNIFGICTAVFGRVLGRLFIVLYVWYAFHLGSLVLRNFSAFIQITTFDQMPQVISLLAVSFLAIWVARRGVQVLGRWSVIALPILALVVLTTILLLIKDMHPENLEPVGRHLSLIPEDAWSDFTFPLGETVLFLGLFNTVKPGGKPGKAWLYGVLIGSGILLFSLLRNILVLGHPYHDDVAFPSYGTVSVIIAGSFISRIENAVGANLLLAGFVKVGVCLIVASKGTAALFGEEDYRPYAAPLGLAMVALASIVYSNVMQMFEFLPVYPYYAFPFQIILPALLLIAAEIRRFVKARKEKGGAPSPAPASGR